MNVVANRAYASKRKNAEVISNFESKVAHAFLNSEYTVILFQLAQCSMLRRARHVRN